jgi:hypothetical protein
MSLCIAYANDFPFATEEQLPCLKKLKYVIR